MLTWQRHGLECRRSLGEYVVSTLVKSWGFSDALQVFTGFLWTARLWFLGKPPSWGTPRQAKAGGLENVSLQIFSPSSGCSRLVCGSLSDLEEGKRIHDDVLKYRVKQTKTSLLYEMMRVEGPSPTDGTCVGVLQSCACSQIWTKMLQVVTDQEECAGKGQHARV